MRVGRYKTIKKGTHKISQTIIRKGSTMAAREKKKLSVREMHKLLKSGLARLRPLKYILDKEQHGYNKNYIRDWFKF